MSEGRKAKSANPELLIHHAIALWAASGAEPALPTFEELRADDGRPRAAIAALCAWELGEIPMTARGTAAFAAHAAARDASEADAPAAVAAARAAGQACAMAHKFDHTPHAAACATKAAGLHGLGKIDRLRKRSVA